ncbi:lipase 1-like isoform X1 [Sitophilus oryzae]|uniref:Lipase n=1 Tax=Sitophilus oryzae TaxID=7048 RepID=A0A6J2XF39_SITOR|nr:lipase 1-like isoform X1 [Sitophilus oryzae]
MNTVLICVSVLLGLISAQSVPSVENLIKSDGYPVETHFHTTSDGYILRIHRIPQLKNHSAKVALVHHGLACSSADFLLLGPGQALPYMLHDAGFDVWLLNDRGNTQSRNHTTLSPHDRDFWDFSWHEIGVIDLPETIDLILKTTGASEIYYVGHSQGTTTLYVMTAVLPEYSSKIKVAISMAPIAFLGHLNNWVQKYLARFVWIFTEFTQSFGHFEVMFGPNVANQKILDIFLFLNRPVNMNENMKSKINAWVPAGASTKQTIHYSQLMNSGHFRYYDYFVGNIAIYGSIEPPDYDLGHVNFPNYLFWSNNDLLSSEKDVKLLCKAIGSSCTMVSFSHYNTTHRDYLYSRFASEKIYSKIVNIFNKS